MGGSAAPAVSPARPSRHRAAVRRYLGCRCRSMAGGGAERALCQDAASAAPSLGERGGREVSDAWRPNGELPWSSPRIHGVADQVVGRPSCLSRWRCRRATVATTPVIRDAFFYGGDWHAQTPAAAAARRPTARLEDCAA